MNLVLILLTILSFNFARADVLKDLTDNYCEFTIDYQPISPRKGEFGHGIFHDDKSGIYVMVSPIVDSSISVYLTKRGETMSIQSGFISLKRKSEPRIKIFEATLCGPGEVGCKIEFSCNTIVPK